MIDNFAILFFGLCIIYVAHKAASLDRKLPWWDRKTTRNDKVEKVSRKKH